MQSGNKTIAKNTLLVYARLIITILVGLVTSRLVLQALGASDFGLYNVVGGMVALFAFISGSLSATTTRFISFEIGNPDGNINRIFNICHLLHLFFALIVLLFVEVIGVFYIENYLNVAYGKEGDAMYVFQVSILVTCIGLANIPFQSLFIAYEKFGTIAVIDIINAVLKLLFAVLLFYYKGNVLRFYALSMSVITLVSFVAYHYLCYQKWPNVVKWKVIRGRSNYREVLSFNNYNMIASASLIARTQGSAMLINYFFGTVVNAAYSVAFTVQSLINTFVGNFDAAATPQITRAISCNNSEKAFNLSTKVCRICLLLMEALYFTLLVELEFVLHVWLGDDIPKDTLMFCQYTLLIAVVGSTAGGLTKVIDGIGKVKWFKIQFSILYLGCLVVGYVMFKVGMPAYSIILLFVFADMISRINQLLLLRWIAGFDSMRFSMEAYKRPILVFVLMLGYVEFYRLQNINVIWGHVAGIVITFVIVSLLCFYIGLTKPERSVIMHKMIQIVNRANE